MEVGHGGPFVQENRLLYTGPGPPRGGLTKTTLRSQLLLVGDSG